MKTDLLLLIKKHTDTHTEQTKTKPQKVFEYKFNKQMDTFSFSPPVNLTEAEKWLLAERSLETTEIVFIVADENNTFSVSTPGHWTSKVVMTKLTNSQSVRA